MKPRAGALSGINVIEAGNGMAVSLVGRFLADCGCGVIRVGGELRSDPFRDRYPAFDAWHSGKTLCLDPCDDDFDAMLKAADIAIVGGEELPGVERGCLGTADEVSVRHPHLVILDIAGAPRAGPFLPAHDLLAQARSGMVFEQLGDPPVVYPMRPPTYGAVLQGLIGLLAAVFEREESGRGQVVRTSLTQGALSWLVARWTQVTDPDGRTSSDLPKGLQWPIFRCSDGNYLQLALGTPGAFTSVYSILGLPTDDLPSHFAIGDRSPKNYFIDYDLVGPLFAKWDSKRLLAELTNAGVPAGICGSPGDCWDDSHVVALGSIVSAADDLDRVGLPIDGL